MLNLLFISDSPKAEYAKNWLQPVLRVIVDIATDFDSGLKAVFEKRPTTVCIQDQIRGVTGESVARHIQMLLGNNAPTFILLYTEAGKAKVIKGLYEYAIDLSQSNEMLAEDIQNTLKQMLGAEWGKIYIPPKPATPSVGTALTEPEKSHDDIGKPVDDLFCDLEMPSFSAAENQPPADTPFVDGQNVDGDKNKSIAAVSRPPVTPSVADFSITQNTLPADEQIPEDMFLELEENYRSNSMISWRNVVTVLVLIAGGWYLVAQKPQLAVSLKQRLIPTVAAKQTPATAPVTMPVQKQAPVPVQAHQPVMKQSLPAFIPKNGYDSAFAVKNPGWERYLNKSNEFRLFSTSDRIEAIQVLAIKDATVSEILVKSVLQEFTGSAEYQITSRDIKAGVNVERGKVNDKGEVVIYKKNGAVKAIVVSVN